MRNPLRVLPPPLARKWTQRVLTMEALILLPLAAFAQKCIPMIRWSRVLGEVYAVPTNWVGRRIESVPVAADNRAEYMVAAAVRRADRILPFTLTCLAQATTGQVLLRQMGTPGVVVFGLRPRPEGEPGKWKAHAWLLGRRGALTGGPAASGFTPTSVYSVRGGLQADDVNLNPAS